MPSAGLGPAAGATDHPGCFVKTARLSYTGCVATNPGEAPAARPAGRAALAWDERGWRRHAACRGEDPELFFPVGSPGPVLEQIAAAKALCAKCPVRAACLRFALETGQGYGIWGGLTEDERRNLRRRERSAAIRPARSLPRERRLAR